MRKPFAISIPLVLALFAVAMDGQNLLVKEDFNEGRVTAAGGHLQGTGIVDDKRGGKCITGSTAAYFPVSKYWNLAGGTVEFKVCFLEPSTNASLDNWCLFRIQAPFLGQKDSFANSFNIINGWGAGLFLLLGDKAGSRTTLRYTGVSAWRPGEWHLVSFAWKIENPGRSWVALYVDGALANARKDFTLEFEEEAWKGLKTMETPTDLASHQKGSVLFGGGWGKNAAGCIDDVKIWDFPRPYDFVK
ncbi:MAG: hypothetical protein J0L75_12140 [Spirochaetes bacterium]|nr:hypothetical protein [Spirochaetota bacterium]